MSFKDSIVKDSKENVYAFYVRIQPKALDYDKITRNDIYHDIISLYKEDPEIILRLCSMEEIHILQNLLDGNIKKQENGYIDYLLFRNLRNNYLILEENGEYKIPVDLVNYVKMAMNLLDEKFYAIQDVMDSVILGILQVYNTLELDEVIELLKQYHISFSLPDLEKYLKVCPKINSKVELIRYRKKEYLVSTEFLYYKDVSSLRKNFKKASYSLEEMISFGKYHLNLFDKEVLNFLNFLEIHLDAVFVFSFLQDLIFYCGFDLNNESILWQICDGVEELYQKVNRVVAKFPVWIYYGNDLKHFEENMFLPDKNDLCPCGSKKKYKNCCGKRWKSKEEK